MRSHISNELNIFSIIVIIEFILYYKVYEYIYLYLKATKNRATSNKNNIVIIMTYAPIFRLIDFSIKLHTVTLVREGEFVPRVMKIITISVSSIRPVAILYYVSYNVYILLIYSQVLCKSISYKHNNMY